MNRDHLIIEFLQLRAELKGISPKLELYRKIQKKMMEIEKLCGGAVSGVPKLKKKIYGKN